VPLPPELDQALLHGTSLGGARPKVFLEDGQRRFIAKFSTSTDLYSVVKAEYIAMPGGQGGAGCCARAPLQCPGQGRFAGGAL
jgi:hypothetical protein